MTDEARWLSTAEQALWRAWVRANVVQHAQIARDLKTAGLSEPDFEVLVHLTDQPDGGLRMSELADGLQWERSRLSHQVGRMEKRGLIERHDVAEDGRGACVAVTPQGREVIEAAAPGHVATVRRIFVDRLDDADRVALRRILDKLEA